MQRILKGELLKWRKQLHPFPLIIRGARQVGKSYLIDELGREQFKSQLTVNFELQPSLGDCFKSLDPAQIVKNLELSTGIPIRPGETLLFLDEIQECPQAIQSLRYFKEKTPELHVISAGSLLEFTLQEEKFSFPVGRVQFMYLKPLSFQEFLMAGKNDLLINHLSEVTLDAPPASSTHSRLLDLYRNYLLVGGMPAAVRTFFETSSFLETRRIHQLLLQAYQSDFGKYATKTQHKHLQRFFEKAPGIVGNHFKYVEVDPETRSRELKIALKQLTWSGLIYCVNETNASGIPLSFQADENKFKLLFLDVGLMQTASKVDIDVLSSEDILQIRSGALAEQAVGQEIIAYSDSYEPPQLFFWKREKKSSEAEIDYVIQIGSKIFPIEVKAGKTGRLRSLKQFMEEKRSSFGIRISSAPLSFELNVLSIPFYLVSQLERIVKSVV